MIGIISEGESGSELPVFYDIIVEDVVLIWDACVSNKGVPMSLDEFYWEVAGGSFYGIVEGEVVSSVGFLGDQSDRSCDVRG